MKAFIQLVLWTAAISGAYLYARLHLRRFARCESQREAASLARQARAYYNVYRFDADEMWKYKTIKMQQASAEAYRKAQGA